MLALDADGLRGLVGGSADRFDETGEIVRRLALAMLAEHLRGGRDVVLPQYLGRVSELERFERAARDGGGTVRHVVLLDDVDASVRRFGTRGDRADDPWHAQVREAVAASGGEESAADDARPAARRARRPSRGGRRAEPRGRPGRDVRRGAGGPGQGMSSVAATMAWSDGMTPVICRVDGSWSTTVFQSVTVSPLVANTQSMLLPIREPWNFE